MQISRSAYLIGTVAPADRDVFNRDLDQRIVPLVRKMPGVADANLHFTQSSDSGAPQIYAVLVILFASEGDMKLALSSPVRAEMQAKFQEILPMFSGEIFHVNAHIGVGQ